MTEAAAIPVVCPKKLDAKLGDVIGELNTNTKWTLPHQREHAEARAREVLLAMVRLFDRGQHDRHAGAPVPCWTSRARKPNQGSSWPSHSLAGLRPNTLGSQVQHCQNSV